LHAKLQLILAIFYFIYRDFGPKVINTKPLIKKMPVLVQNRDEGVRNKAKTLVIEVYRWTGDALKPQLNFFKPVQVSVTLLARSHFSHYFVCRFYCVSYV
jgi:hypothetical protein